MVDLIFGLGLLNQFALHDEAVKAAEVYKTVTVVSNVLSKLT